MNTSDIAVSGLHKAFGNKTVLDGISFDVAAGSVFSMLGPNGAGKTTTVNIMTTLIKADAGTVRVADHADLDAAARILPGSAPDDQELTVRVQSGGDTASLRALLGRLDEYSINAAEFSVHTPDLDDVFLALTGHANNEVNAQ